MKLIMSGSMQGMRSAPAMSGMLGFGGVNFSPWSSMPDYSDYNFLKPPEPPKPNFNSP